MIALTMKAQEAGAIVIVLTAQAPGAGAAVIALTAQAPTGAGLPPSAWAIEVHRGQR